MAQLTDTVVAGSLRATDSLLTNNLQTKIINAPTASNGTTFGPGTNGQVLKSNGTSIYWTSDNNSDVNVKQLAAITTAGAYPVLLANSTATTEVTNTVNKTSTLTYNPNTKALSTGGTVNGLTLSAQTTGFKISGGTTSKTLTVGADYTLAAACAKGVTDNSSNTDVTSSDTNLITGRTLYYQLAKKGYTTNTGTVTKVSTGAGLTGGDVTTTGTIKAKLRSETALTNDSAAATETSGRVYPVAVDKSGYLAVNVPWTTPVTSVAGKTGAVTLAKGDVGLGNVTNDAQIPKSIGTAAGDIIYWSAASTPARLAKGSNGQVLKINSSGVPAWATDANDNTKNTAGTSNKADTKMFLVAATEQSANPTTYSNSNCYIGTDNCLYSGGTKVLTAHQSISGKLNTSGGTISGNLVVSKLFRNIVTGSGTAGQAGSSSVTYIPSKWKFNLNTATPTAGDMLTIKVPVAGVNAGVYMSTDNGTTYYPVAVDYGKSRLTTHYPVNSLLTLVYMTGFTTTVYPLAGGTGTSDVTTGRWQIVNFYNTNTTYSNASLGQGYGTCGTAEATAAKVVSLGSYALTTGGIVAVKFTYAVPANATMNINSKGAKNIFYKGAKITGGIIDAGDIVTFIYDGTQYQFLCKDTGGAGAFAVANGVSF